MTPLGTIAEVSTGYPFRTRVEPEEGGDLILVQIRDLDGAEGFTTAGTIMLRSDHGKYQRYLLEAGDLLFQSRGSRHPAVMIKAGTRGVAAPGLHVIRPHTAQVLPEYLAWWLNHPTSQLRIREDLARGSYVPFVSKRDLERLQVPVPSLSTQKQIVEVDALHRTELRLCARLEKLTQQLVDAATLTAAMSKGKRNSRHD
jgi:hypothetical protein